MALDLGTAIFGHDADDEPANDRNQNYPESEVAVAGAPENGTETAIECDVGKQANQFVEKERNAAGEQSYGGSQKRNQYQAERRCSQRLLLRRGVNTSD
jgi:hypothetical protein